MNGILTIFLQIEPRPNFQSSNLSQLYRQSKTIFLILTCSDSFSEQITLKSYSLGYGITLISLSFLSRTCLSPFYMRTTFTMLSPSYYGSSKLSFFSNNFYYSNYSFYMFFFSFYISCSNFSSINFLISASLMFYKQSSTFCDIFYF